MFRNQRRTRKRQAKAEEKRFSLLGCVLFLCSLPVTVGAVLTLLIVLHVPGEEPRF